MAVEKRKLLCVCASSTSLDVSPASPRTSKKKTSKISGYFSPLITKTVNNTLNALDMGAVSDNLSTNQGLSMQNVNTCSFRVKFLPRACNYFQLDWWIIQKGFCLICLIFLSRSLAQEALAQLDIPFSSRAITCKCSAQELADVVVLILILDQLCYYS